MKETPKSNAIRRSIYLYRILAKESDEEHYLSTAELMRRLETEFGLIADRLTIGHDLDVMRECGIPIYKEKLGNKNRYALCERLFDYPELKLLIDSVASSKVVPVEKCQSLIEKLSSLASDYNTSALADNLALSERAKPENQRVYYIIQTISEAIEQKRKLSFSYFEYDERKQRVLKNNGEPYIVSPYSLVWDGDFYYLVCYTEKRQKIQHFRVDRIVQKPEILHVPVVPQSDDYNVAERQKAVFRMFADDEIVQVDLQCRKHLMNQVVDQFGKDVDTEPTNDGSGSFVAHVIVAVSPTFYRWVFGFCGDVQILGPESVRGEYARMVREAAERTEIEV